jgi:hypothetical protein
MRIYRMMRRWQADGSIDRIFSGTVHLLHQDRLLDLSVIHGDGTTTAVKKGGDNLGYSGHKHRKGDKVVAFCDPHCNVIAPFISAPGNRNGSPLLRGPAQTHRHGLRHWRRPAAPNRQSGWRLRLPGQSAHDPEHPRKPAWAQNNKTRPQAALRRSNLLGAFLDHRPRLYLGRHIPPPAAALRAHQ